MELSLHGVLAPSRRLGPQPVAHIPLKPGRHQARTQQFSLAGLQGLPLQSPPQLDTL